MNRNKRKIAFLTGCTGQDGSYLTELLLEKGYIVHGLIRRASLVNTARIDHIYENIQTKNPNLILHYGDMTDFGVLHQLLNNINPDEVYNLAAMSHVKVSFEIPVYTTEVDAVGTLKLLEACKNLSKKVKFYQAGTSELYGGICKEKQNESTPFYPKSPYAVAKLYSHYIVINYRESYNMFAVNGILFNHTSPRRGKTFVEQKIVQGAVAISLGKKDCLYLGNIYTYRDFGHSKDFVKAMWLIMQNDSPKDYVIASGEKYMIKDIVNKVFNMLNMELKWYGEGLDEYAEHNNKIVIRIDKQYYRPNEVQTLHGDSSKALEELNWKPEYNINSILREMIDHEKSKDNNSIIK
jgi:GDPmannose 4,6-dehydratase